MREALAMIFREYDVRVVNDAGCGDFNWMKRVDLSGIDYLGYDIVQWGEALPFKKLNIATEVMRKCDLIICRDVLFHLPNEVVSQAIDLFRQSGDYLFATSHYNAKPERHRWSTIIQKNYSPVDLTRSEFGLGKPINTFKETPSQYMGLWRFT